MQTTFQVTLKSAADPVFHTRKAHTKSRAGCANCKKRRVKCDERKPRCTICSRRNLDCVYTTSRNSPAVVSESSGTTPASTSTENASLQSPNAMAYNLHIQGIHERLSDLFASISLEGTGISEQKSLRDLQHFQSYTTQTLGFSTSRRLVVSFVSAAIWQHAHLMHMVLAIANAHQKRLHEASGVSSEIKLAEASHWQVALSLYQKEIASLHNGGCADQDSADALLGTHVLCTVYTSTVADKIPLDIFLTGTEDDVREVYSPMVHSGGFPLLMRTLSGLEPQSTWSPMLHMADDESGSFTDYKNGIDGLPPAWVALCGLTAESTCDNHPYHRLVRTLTPLLRMRLGKLDMPKLFAFIGRNWMHSRHLLMNKDPVAMLIIAWWLSLLRQLNVWWIMTRASTQCAAIVKYLQTVDEPRFRPFLSFPASFGMADYSWIWSEDWKLVQQNLEERDFTDPQLLCLPS